MNGTFLSKLSAFLRQNVILILIASIGISLFVALLVYVSKRSLEEHELCWFNAQGERVQALPRFHREGDSPVFDCRTHIGTAETLDR